MTESGQSAVSAAAQRGQSGEGTFEQRPHWCEGLILWLPGEPHPRQKEKPGEAFVTVRVAEGAGVAGGEGAAGGGRGAGRGAAVPERRPEAVGFRPESSTVAAFSRGDLT